VDNEVTGRKKCVDYVKKAAQFVAENYYGKGEVLNLLHIHVFIKNRRISFYHSLISNPETELTLSSETSAQPYNPTQCNNPEDSIYPWESENVWVTGMTLLNWVAMQ
jgi:hypothetical protein